MNIATWQKFVDTGYISNHTLHAISSKIKAQKPLTQQEQAVYQTYALEIETLIKHI